jgi:hypothetical protein
MDILPLYILLAKNIISKNSTLGSEKELKFCVSIYLKICVLLEDAGNVTAELVAMILTLGEINRTEGFHKI